jgi:dihydroorotate dehydrogenase electron transfer subunit
LADSTIDDVTSVHSTHKIITTLAKVVSNDDVIPNHKVLRCHAPEIAEIAQPGHFVNSLASETISSILRKPFSIYKAHRDSGDISLLYQLRGATTFGMARKRPGDFLDLVGPLGGHVFKANTDPEITHVMVGGGYGVPPLIFLGSEISKSNPNSQIHYIIGARSQAMLACLDDPYEFGATLDTCTDDGSYGIQGRVTDAIVPLINSGKKLCVYTCGPTPMMMAVAKICNDSNISCQVSLEVPMPCGVGVCMGCVVDLADSRRVRACTEGPVFDSKQVMWK